jgi:hypothetical protein
MNGDERPLTLHSSPFFGPPVMVTTIWNASLCGLLTYRLADFRYLNEHFAHNQLDITAKQLIEQGTQVFHWLPLLHFQSRMHIHASQALQNNGLVQLRHHNSNILPRIYRIGYTACFLPGCCFGDHGRSPRQDCPTRNPSPSTHFPVIFES